MTAPGEDARHPLSPKLAGHRVLDLTLPLSGYLRPVDGTGAPGRAMAVLPAPTAPG